MTIRRWPIPRTAHCDGGGLMAAAALTLAIIALAVAAVAVWLCVRSQPGPFIHVSGRLTAGTQAQVTVKPVTPPRPSQPPRPEEPPS